jgi:hypothetical protein
MTTHIRDPIDKDILEFRHLLNDTLGQSISDAQRFQFDDKNPQHLLTVCLYATIVQAAHDCAILLDEETVTIVGGALRSIVESWADLTSIIADENYGQRMAVTFAHEKKRYFQNMLQYPKNPFFADMARHLNADVALKATTTEIAKYEKDGHKPLSNKERLNRAGLADIYQAFYWQLCLDSHNSAAMLQVRHMEEDGAGNLKINLFGRTTNIQRINLLDPLVAILLDAGKRTHELFKTGLAQVYEQRRAAFDQFRRKVQANSRLVE